MINRIKNTVREMRRWGLLFPIKFKIAEIESDRDPNVCWASAATWAMGCHGRDDIDRSGGCLVSDSDGCAACWCHKNVTAEYLAASEASTAAVDAPF